MKNYGKLINMLMNNYNFNNITNNMKKNINYILKIRKSMTMNYKKKKDYKQSLKNYMKSNNNF